MAQYNWIRYWVPRDTTPHLIANSFFDHDSVYGQYYNKNSRTLLQLDDLQCIVLLGEPGMGKSTDLKFVTAQYEQQNEHSVQFIDLRNYNTPDRLERKLQANINQWRKSSGKLILLLDSLDEGLLETSALASVIVELLQDITNNLNAEERLRLRLRISCRDVNWPANIESDLSTIFNKSIGFYRLAPLSENNVLDAARTAGIGESDTFLELVHQHNVAPLAARPITLIFLLKIYTNNQSFAGTQSDLYFRGCLQLCEESSIARRDLAASGKPTNKLTPSQRMEIASRIAALTIFCNRSFIRQGLDPNSVPEEELCESDIIGNEQQGTTNSILIDNAAITETLQCPLFIAITTRSGSRIYQWAHQTYTEFLAAWHLHNHNVPLIQLKSLFIHPDQNARVIPQLYQTAAWLSNLNNEFRNLILQHDPEVLLRSDLLSINDSDRETLVESLLKKAKKDTLTQPTYDRSSDLKLLTHPNLSQQLYDIISDHNAPDPSRRLALSLAKACKTQELVELLIEVALDISVAPDLRIDALRGIYDIGPSSNLKRIKDSIDQLELDDNKKDPYGQLKGWILQVLWPNILSMQELLPLLGPPKHRLIGGSYSEFLSSRLPSAINIADLPSILIWAAHNTRDTNNGHFEHLIEHIILQAWENIDRPDIATALAPLFYRRIRNNTSLVPNNFTTYFQESIRADTNRRRNIIDSLVEYVSTLPNNWSSAANHIARFVEVNDVVWMAEHLDEALKINTTSKVKVWCRIISVTLDYENYNDFDYIFTVAERVPALKDAIKPFLSTSLESSDSKYQKRSWHRNNGSTDLIENSADANITTALLELPGHISDLLSGHNNAWLRIRQILSITADGKYIAYSSDLTRGAIWPRLDDFTQKSLLESIQSYAMQYHCNSNPTSALELPSPPGFDVTALLLLQKAEPDLIGAIPDNAWEQLLPAIAGYEDYSNEPYFGLIINRTYRTHQNALLHLIKSEIPNSSYLHHYLCQFSSIWDTNIENVAWDSILSDNLTERQTEDTLTVLLMHKSPHAKDYIIQQLSTIPPRCSPDRNRSIRFAQLLAQHAEDAGWNHLWQLIESDPMFGEELIRALASHGSSWLSGLASRISEPNLADLYIWLEYIFPREFPNRPIEEVNYFDMQISSLRSGILNTLSRRGTSAAIKALKDISSHFPSHDWVPSYILDGETSLNQATWLPLSPASLVRFIRNPDTRLISSANDLMDIILESLTRLQDELQGIWRPVTGLWNETQKIKQGKKEYQLYKPKNEAALSNKIAEHLYRDLKGNGIICIREPEISPTLGIVPGQELDIQITLSTPHRITGSYDDPISVIIEVKGQWNAELKNSMQEQLTQRYIVGNNLTMYGIYLVGYYYCDQWDNDDKKRKQQARRNGTKEELTALFEAQASQLSANGIVVKSFLIDVALGSDPHDRYSDNDAKTSEAPPLSTD